MPKPWYSIKAETSAGSEVAEVSILEPISPWYGCDAKSFLTEFRALKAAKVKLYINSPGGSVVEALTIFNGMRATNKQIEVHVLGVAASAASYIAMAGHKIVMPRNTMMFLHNPINAVYGNADEMREMADTLDKFASMLTATYMKRWKGEEQALKDILSAESYLTAAECLEHGLCDEVVDEITAEARFDIEMLPEAVQALFKRTAPPAPRTGMPLAELERVAGECGVAEFAASLAVDPALTSLDAVRAAAMEAKDVLDLCRLTGRADQAAAFVKARKPIADVRAEIRAAMAAEDEQTAVDTAAKSTSLQPPASKEFDPLAVWDGLANKTWSTK